MNIWHEMNPARVSASHFDAVVEIPRGSKSKYELDKETGFLRLDRVLYTSTHYPANYGFIPRTLAEDNDPLDVLVLSDETFTPLSIIPCYPIGVIRMIDGNQRDEKIIAVAQGDPNYNGYQSIQDLPQHIFNEMSHFFSVYKQLEGKQSIVESLGDAEEARTVIEAAITLYRKTFDKE
ncbi:inorganic diphosphatase [Clostridium minihomine]|uniref:inorganic diphosphatase n=1 Tax=Clostridium minihomine TaxID=2045012 RepID=UPI000C75E0B0|nr:inorganic diphosphatase [Clostridium minihomine]